ncbi:terminase gpA endonuclease subunit [Pseudomonas sp. TB1-B1]|uniref:terminase gpA endonuclease subunit n=1 Tax=Pseudomonas sp. TB1-B1 TaxID=2985515 RepID=UPI002271E864|nr:terminase gpA endonuclease subunit [Pseudomonas sp. TB1-B1]MCX9150578.1 phage terminase large subunit family protein [Pseudomonas sp. TB1-B1]
MTYVDEWAAENMQVPESILGPGPYRIERTPYAREPMRCLSHDHPSKRVVVMAATLTMKTQIAINWVGSLVHTSPSNILVLLPSRQLAVRLGHRISKSFKATPVLRNCFSSAGDWCSRSYDGGSLRLAGAYSLVSQSFPADFVCCEQIDHWPVDIEPGVDLLELAEGCVDTSVQAPKFYFTGTPTVKGASKIEKLFFNSDQRHYYVPCPYCSHSQTLEWEQIRYSSDFQAVHYQCGNSACASPIAESSLSEMVALGEWRSHSDGDGQTSGFHLNALYSPPSWLGWTELAKQYERAKKELADGDASPMRMFYNFWLAKVWDGACG